MSHPDSNQIAEFEHPPGLGPIRPPGNPLSSSDRRPTFATRNLPIQSSASPFRSVDQDYSFGIPPSHWSATPNRHTPALSLIHHTTPPSFHNHPAPPSPPPTSSNNITHTISNLDTELFHHNHSQSTSFNNPSRSTLWWGELEAWMDEEYAKQVCGLMGWDPVNVNVPNPAPDAATGQQANNAGYCFLTFPTPAHAASVLAQIGAGTGQALAMPNSNKPFVLNWSSSVPTATSLPSSTMVVNPVTQQQYPQEYSIFVGDLAPETSNSDLVAVFRNPVLGLRNDRAPKFIRPFLSCKSAKIMLDPVTGVSRGYGFVRFTDEADQQRALIEMHGLYCLSRPMRISPATAKFKPAIPPLPPIPFHPQPADAGLDPKEPPITIAVPLSSAGQSKSVSTPIATASSHSSNVVSGSSSGSSIGGSTSTNSLTTGTTCSNTSIASSAFASASSDEMINLPNEVLVQIAQQYANGNSRTTTNGGNTLVTQLAHDGQEDGVVSRYAISEESWKHHAQARAILGNLIGPNGEQLTSTDPYNTTVFVGGLSPLISEETLRTFFAPFGDIHYVKVPVGKHCGFVQFVRKADAERAIEKMQGFPIGGSRIRLSWGRSQYKAAQAAAQAAQAAALQAQYQAQFTGPNYASVSPEQAFQLLQKFGIQARLDSNSKSVVVGPEANTSTSDGSITTSGFTTGNLAFSEEQTRPTLMASKEEGSLSLAFDSYASTAPFGRQPTNTRLTNGSQTRLQSMSSFSPFSPDPTQYIDNAKRTIIRPDLLPHPSRNYAPGFAPLSQDLKVGSNGKTSPTSTRPPSRSRYGPYLDNSLSTFQTKQAAGEQEGMALSRPPSGQTSHSSHGARAYEGTEHESIQDLNGTLASLDLDQTHPPWSSPVVKPDLPNWGISRIKSNRSPHPMSPPP